MDTTSLPAALSPDASQLVLARALPAARHPVAVYLARLAPGSRRTMRQALDRIAAMATGGKVDAQRLAWASLRYQHSAALRAMLAAQVAPATASKILSALRGVLRECWRLGLMSAEEYQRAADVAAVKGERLPAGRALQPGELRALFQSCASDGTAGAHLDAALLGILAGCGLRRSEAALLELKDYDRGAGELRVRHGKGSKQRLVPIGNGSQDALEAWLAVRGDQPGRLFLAVHRSGSVAQGSGLTAQAIYARLARRAKAAGVRAFSPHDLRRTTISSLLDAGADLVAVRDLVGHARVETTARYDRRGEHAKRKAAALMHVPYVPRLAKS